MSEASVISSTSIVSDKTSAWNGYRYRRRARWSRGVALPAVCSVSVACNCHPRIGTIGARWRWGRAKKSARGSLTAEWRRGLSFSAWSLDGVSHAPSCLARYRLSAAHTQSNPGAPWGLASAPRPAGSAAHATRAAPASRGCLPPTGMGRAACGCWAVGRRARRPGRRQERKRRRDGRQKSGGTGPLGGVWARPPLPMQGQPQGTDHQQT